jgi:hypothetical protein
MLGAGLDQLSLGKIPEWPGGGHELFERTFLRHATSLENDWLCQPYHGDRCSD